MSDILFARGSLIRYLVLLAFVFFLSPVGWAIANQDVAYEPAVVSLSGIVGNGKFQHSNGRWYQFSVLAVSPSLEIKRDEGNSVNVDEKNVKEIQLYSDSIKIRRFFKSKEGKLVTVEGTIFHGHTVWHVRKLVINVSNVK